MRIGLIPLDERPVNTRYPLMIAGIAGINLVLPPRELLSSYRTPAPCDELAAWLRGIAGGLDGLIVSCEMLGYGGLIASRITDESSGLVMRRLDLLRDLKRDHPERTIYGFNLITRVSNADSAIEEPRYWAHAGTRMYRLSQLLDRAAQDEPIAAELESLRAELDPADVDDFLRRRARNHAVNLAVLHMLAEDAFDLLVLSSDDTNPYGLPSAEKRWLTHWADLLGLSDRSIADTSKSDIGYPVRTNPKCLMYPGADEVGCALLARMINRRAGRVPRFEIAYAIPGGEEIVAPYEDGPVRVTVERQIRAVGGEFVERDGDFWLAVNPPVPRRSEWHPAHAAQERAERLPYLESFVDQIGARMDAGQRVIVADVAYPNGSDPVLIDLLRERIDLTRLVAYGAWNTAGNTIGTALAQGCAALDIRTEAQQRAQTRCLLHRFVEDWGYQQGVRAETRDWLQSRTEQHDPTPANLAATQVWIECRLQERVEQLPGFAGRYRIVPGSVHLPWQRTFEVDFELERMEGGA